MSGPVTDPRAHELRALSYWDFRVLSRRTIEEHGARSLSKKFLDSYGAASVPPDDLAAAIEQAHLENAGE